MSARVLIVDDALFMRKMLTDIFKKNGYDVVGEASNGKEGYEKYKELKPDVVTMDITMPGTTGIEGTQMIIKEFPNARIIMCSAMGQESMVLEAIRAGAKNFIVKPFQPDKVMEAVQQVLR
ncbi:MAG: response regulator [Clostridia bacterium]|nr:response regulator [Clostridia bacterium]